MNSWGLCGSAYQLPGWSRAGHQEVAGTLGRRARQRRRLDLHEAVTVEDVAGRLVDLAAQPHRRGGAAAAQVEVAVPQPRLLPHVDVLVDRERQHRARVEHHDLVGDHLDLAGGHVRVGVALGAQRDRRR